MATADGHFIWTTAVVVDSDGLVYVSDEHLNRISVFDGDGRFLRKWGTPGSGPGELDGPSGMALDSEGHIWIADHRNHRIQRFTRDGDFLTHFGSQGSGEGQLELPWGITVAPTGDLYVSDWGNDRIQQFTAEGDFVAAYGERGQGEGQFRRPSGVAVDEGGYIYVADWGNSRVQLLDPDGAFAASARGEATLSPWAHDFLESNIEERDARAVSNLEPDLVPRRRRERGVVPHREAVLGACVGQAGRGRQRLRGRPQQAPRPGVQEKPRGTKGQRR